MRGFWSLNLLASHDFPRGDRASIEVLVGAAIGTERGTFERDSGKRAARAGIAQDFRAHVRVGVRGRISPERAGSDREIAAEFHFGVHQASRAAIIHHEQHEVSGFATNLETETATFERDHYGRAPLSGEILAGAADHRAAAETSADNKRGLVDRRHDYHATRVIEKVARNVIGNIHDFPHDYAGVLQAGAFVFCPVGIVRERKRSDGKQRECDSKSSFHGTIPPGKFSRELLGKMNAIEARN